MWSDKKELFESALADFFRAKKPKYTKKLFDAMEYSLFSGGKRIRPILMMLVADFVNIEYEKILPFAISMECIHTYSLIHDDLPCMDNDSLRRGKATNHVVYGQAMALLSGDCLLNLAMENLLDSASKYPCAVESAKLLAQCAGGEGMIGGQAMEFSLDNLGEDTIVDLYNKKTGALIKASVLIPCMLSENTQNIADLSDFAFAVGLSFQLIDDLLDKKKMEEKSYISLMGEQKTLELLQKLNKMAYKALSNLGDKALELQNFYNYLSKRKI